MRNMALPGDANDSSSSSSSSSSCPRGEIGLQHNHMTRQKQHITIHRHIDIFITPL